MAPRPENLRPPHPAWTRRTPAAPTADTSTAEAAPLSMANTKAELVQAAVDAGYDQASLEGYTKPELLGLFGTHRP